MTLLADLTYQSNPQSLTSWHSTINYLKNWIFRIFVTSLSSHLPITCNKGNGMVGKYVQEKRTIFKKVQITFTVSVGLRSTWCFLNVSLAML